MWLGMMPNTKQTTNSTGDKTMNNTEKLYELAIRISCRCRLCNRGGDYSMENCLKIANEAASHNFLDRALNAMRNN